MRGTLHRHRRFLLAFAFGLALVAGLRAAGWQEAWLAALVGFDSFAAAYLGLTLIHLNGVSAQDLRRHAQVEDEGIGVIAVLACGAVAVSVGAILVVLNGDATSAAAKVLALAAVPLGWAMVQTLAGIHYAFLHYRRGSGAPVQFPGAGGDPGPWDFLYFAFTIGMTAQVSDATIGTTRLRRAVLVHSVLSFFYNTVILALTVNASLTLV